MTRDGGIFGGCTRGKSLDLSPLDIKRLREFTDLKAKSVPEQLYIGWMPAIATECNYWWWEVAMLWRNRVLPDVVYD